jgi:16S rRNA C967 or C1407 C5-methylase (RsmB/RsmF family)
MIFPTGFEARMRLDFGIDIADKVIASIESHVSPTSIRHNPLKNAAARRGTPIPWEPMAEILPERPEFSLDPLWHAGAYYVQEASSMLLGEVFAQVTRGMNAGLNVLDLCGAPGGKSTHLLARMSPDDLLVSNETIRARAAILHENMTKWGYPNSVITQQDPTYFASLGGFFDVIVVDAPCSGEGLWRRDADAVKEWSPEAVIHCAARQSRILEDVWPALRPGGVLIYSTCTYNKEENEAQLARMVTEFGADELRIDVPTEWGFVKPEGCSMWRGLPGLTLGEGFAIGAVRKKESLRSTHVDNRRSSTLRRTKELFWGDLLPEGDWKGLLIGGKTVAVPSHLEGRILALDGMRVVSAGHEMGDERRPSFVGVGEPRSDRVRPVRIPDLRTQLLYLKRESIPVDGPNGVVLAMAGDVPLGYGKAVNGRLNNWYPMEWRLRRSL